MGRRGLRPGQSHAALPLRLRVSPSFVLLARPKNKSAPARVLPVEFASPFAPCSTSRRCVSPSVHIGRAGPVAGRGTGAGLQAGGLRLGSPGPGGRAEASAVVRADPLELVAPGLPAPGEIPPSRGRSVGSWRVGADRPSSSWRWTIGPSSASPGSRPPGAWMNWNGPSWSPFGRMPGRSPIVTILDAAAANG